VLLDDAALVKIVAKHAELKFGPGPVNFQVSGEDVSVARAAGKGEPNALLTLVDEPACREKFVAMPKTN